MTIKETILSLLFEPRFRYKGMSVSAVGLPILFDDYDRASVYTEFSRLKRGGYITQENKYWRLSSKGEEYVKNRPYILDKEFKHSFSDKQPKTLILMFDIPESRKNDRDWLRKILRSFHYVMIQKSVWVWPSPLPKDFLQLLQKVKLKNSIKTFKLAKGYTIKT